MCRIDTELFKNLLSAFKESADIHKPQYELFLYLTLRKDQPAYETVSRCINNHPGYKLDNDTLGHIRSNESWIYGDSPYAQAIRKSDDNDALCKALLGLHKKYLSNVDIPDSCDGILGNLTRFCFCGNHERISTPPPAEQIDFGPLFDGPSSYWDKRSIKNFVKRTGCISQIHEKLEQQNLVILSGPAGIGKTSIIKYYYVEHCRNAPIDFYYVEYKHSLDDTIKSIPFKNNGKVSDKWGTLSEKNQNSLLVIDNMNCLDKELEGNLERLLTLHLKIIVSTRAVKIPILSAVINIESIDDNGLSELCMKILPKTENNREQLKELFTLLERNTLAVSLAIKLAAKQKYSIEELIHVLQNPDDINDLKSITFKHSYSNNAGLGYIGHIRRIYSLHREYLPDYCRTMLGALSCFEAAPVPRTLINDWIRKSVGGSIRSANGNSSDNGIQNADDNWIKDALNSWIKDALDNFSIDTANGQIAAVFDNMTPNITEASTTDAFRNWLNTAAGCWVQSMANIGIFSEAADSYVQMHQLVAKAIFHVERPGFTDCNTLIDTVHDTVLKLRYSLGLPNMQKLIYESIISLSESVKPYNNKGQKSPADNQETWWSYMADCSTYLLSIGETETTAYILKSLYDIYGEPMYDHPFYIFKRILELHIRLIRNSDIEQLISDLKQLRDGIRPNEDNQQQNSLGYSVMTGYAAAAVFDKCSCFSFYRILPDVQYQTLCRLYHIGAARSLVQFSPEALEIFYKFLDSVYLTGQEKYYYKCIYEYFKLNTAAYNPESLSKLVEMIYGSYKPYFDPAVRIKYFCCLMILHSACIFFNTTDLQNMKVHNSHVKGIRQIKDLLDLEVSEAFCLPTAVCHLCIAAYYHYAYCFMDAETIAHSKEKVIECYAKSPYSPAREVNFVLNIFRQMFKNTLEHCKLPIMKLWYIWLSAIPSLCKDITDPN